MRCTLSIIFFLCGWPVFASPAIAVAAALADAQTLPNGIRENTRYLWSPTPYTKEERATLAFHCNSLSRELDLVAPRKVNDNLLAVSLLDYGWNAKTWDKFAETEPYFMVRVVAEKKYYSAGVDSNGNRYNAGWYQNTKREVVPAAAPWLESASITNLISLTQSTCPIVRADWFFSQTAIQEGRKVGYYGMLGLGNKRDDFEKLVGLDRAAAQRLRKEIAAIVPVSSVALHNRQIYRFQTISGPYWETRDAKQNDGDRNAIRLLNGDFKHDAEEIYGTLPNGLFAFFLSDVGGIRANTAPDFIASDSKSSSVDRRVHIGLSCIRCHVPGIQPIDDWARRLYTGPIKLNVTDAQKYLRLKQLYLSDLNKFIKRDQSDYADTLKSLNGLTPAENAKGYAAYWDRYNEEQVDVDRAAKELGTTAKYLTDCIKSQAQTGLFDAVLAGYIQQPPLTIQRSHFEEVQPIIWKAMGYRP